MNLKIVERDPSGLDQHAPGAKLDGDKPRPALIMDDFSLAWEYVDAAILGHPAIRDPKAAKISPQWIPECARQYPRAFMAVAMIAAIGARKYSDTGWLHVKDAVKRYTEACFRHHIRALYEDVDEDSGLPHLAHSIWNMVAVTELQAREGESVMASGEAILECMIQLEGVLKS